MHLLYSIVVPIFFSTLFLLVLFGWGVLFNKAIKIPKNKIYFSSYILFGLISTFLFTKIFHFFIPINFWVSIAFVSIGLLVLLHHKEFFIGALKKLYKWAKANKSYSFFSILILIYWCLRVTKVSTNYDTAAYHLQLIRWINEYPLITGIANLWDHLAFNQSYFEFLALLRFFPFFNEGYSLGSLIFFIITSFVLIERIEDKHINFAWLGFLFFLLTHSAGSTLFSTSPDLIVGFLEIILFSYLLNILNGADSPKYILESIAIIFLLSAYLFTIKLTGLIFGFLTSIFFFTIFFKKIVKNLSFTFKVFLICFFAVCLQLLCGYMLSGYPFFPLSFAGIPSLSWYLPQDIIHAAVSEVYSGARDASILLNFTLKEVSFESFYNWFINLMLGLKIYLVIIFVSLLFLLRNMLKSEELHKTFKLVSLIFIPASISLLFCFYFAPEFRYAGAAFEIVIASLLFILTTQYKNKFLKKVMSKNFFHISLFIILIFSSLTLNPHLFLGWEATPKVRFNEQYLSPAYVVHIPIHDLCWETPLPCVYSLNTNLNMFQPDDVKSGFFIKK